MAILTEFAMFPTDKGVSVSKYVSRIIEIFKQSDYPYQLTPMGTIFETNSMEDTLSVIQRAYDVLEPDCDRIYSTIKFDIKKDKENMMQQKIESIKRHIGDVNH